MDQENDFATEGNLCAQDHLGRRIADGKKAGPPRPGRIAGLFYYLWHGQHGTEGPYDISRMKEQDPDLLAHPESPLWPPAEHVPMLHWGEPLFGYYCSEDEWVLRRHVQLFLDAGIDVLFFDVTNGYSYRPVYMKLFRILQEYRDAGFPAPQFAFYMAPARRGCGTSTLLDVWQDLYSKRLYPDLYFHWKGKPLVICHDDRPMLREIRDFFTFRAPTWKTPDLPNTWYWEGNPKQRVARDSEGNPEEIPVSVCCAGAPEGYQAPYTIGMSEAYWGHPTLSRSFHDGRLDTRPDAVQYGFHFQEQIETALREDAPVAFITQFNEWLVPFLTRKTNTLYGMGHEILLVDEYDIENSRDIEPMRGGYKDAYYLQMADFVRRFKGVRPPASARRWSPISMEGSFDQWDSVTPVYREYTGDVAPRCCRGYDACGIYENRTGRNEFHFLKIAVDREMLSFYAETSAPLTGCREPGWMMLFLKFPGLQAPSWEGFHYVFNRTVDSSGQTWLERSLGGWNWEKAAPVALRFEGKRLMLQCPCRLLGVNAAEPFRFEFKWVDNPQEHDIMDCYVNGDAAPRGRMNYLFEFRPEAAAEGERK